MTRLIIVTAASVAFILLGALLASRLARSRTRGISIRMQVFLALLIIVGTFAAGLGVMVLDRIEARAVRVANESARDEAVHIARFIEQQLTNNGSSLERFAAGLAKPSSRADSGLMLLDATGRLLYPPVNPLSNQEPGSVQYEEAVINNGRAIGRVRVVKPTVVVQRLLADFAPTVLVISLILAAVAAVAAALIGRAIASPIEALSNYAEQVSMGERASLPPPALGAREVSRLRRSFDSMRRQLEGRPFVETFAADLSHELKNPVAAIRASAEVLVDGALEEPEAARRFVERILESSRRIERLLGALVNLARIEARGVESLQRLELGQLVRSAVEGLGDDASRVTLQITGDSWVKGDAPWLGRALANLLDNAFAHGQRGEVLVTVHSEGTQVLLEVQNEGEIAGHVSGRLFRRFVTSRPNSGGTGLGLAIVRSVAEAHGGSVELVQSGPPRVVFRMRLPRASAI